MFRDALTMSDARVLAMIAEAMARPARPTSPAIRRELGRLGPWTGARAASAGRGPGRPVDGTVLATWRQLLDSGVMQDGEPHLAATARPTVALVSAATAAGLGETVTVTGPDRLVTLPVAVGDVSTTSCGCR